MVATSADATDSPQVQPSVADLQCYQDTPLWHLQGTADALIVFVTPARAVKGRDRAHGCFNKRASETDPSQLRP